MLSLMRSSCIKSTTIPPIHREPYLFQNFGIPELYNGSCLRLKFEHFGSLKFWKFKLPNIQNSSFDNLFSIAYSSFNTKKRSTNNLLQIIQFTAFGISNQKHTKHCHSLSRP